MLGRFPNGRPIGRVLAFILAAASAAALAACGGGGTGSSPTVPETGSATPAPISTPTVSPMGVQADWNTFAHDMQRTNFQSAEIGIHKNNVSQLALNWTFNDGVTFEASPIEVGGIVYVVDRNGQMTALNASTGKIVWQQQLGLWVEQTPALYDGKIFVGNHDKPSNLYAVDPATGSVLWTTTVPGGLKGSPVSINGMLYTGVALGDPPICSAGGVYAYNETTGAQGPSWLTEPGAQPDGGAVWSPISYDGSHLYYGTGNTCNNSTGAANAIMSLNPSSMTAAWVDQTAGALSDDDVGGGVSISQNTGLVVSKNGTLYAVNLADGRTLWSATLGDPDGFGPFATPAISSSTIVVPAGLTSYPNGVTPAGGALYGFSLSGQKLWTLKTQYEVDGSPAVTTDLAFVELDNSVAAIDPASGSKLWSFTTVGNFSASPAVTSYGIFAADTSGTLYAFTLPNALSTNANAIRSRTALPARQYGKTRFVHSRPAFCLTEPASDKGRN